ncbi:class I SAM-dependent methyltransferase [Pedobacter sp. AW31-3R]|uniref:class I SAM-dependent methyltransferase n=1 Tax=Pedobacter sp. AW31-3R TaxID=3445781 RepID=UPI003F9EBF39
MSNQHLLEQFLQQTVDSLTNDQFLKMSFGNYQGNEKELKNLYIRKVKVKRVEMLAFNYRYKTRDIFKNFPVLEGLTRISHLISNDFKVCTLFSKSKEVIMEHDRKGMVGIRERDVENAPKAELSHDKVKKRLVPAAEKSYLTDLRITDKGGVVFKNAQDKYKQINQYVSLLDPLIRSLSLKGTQKLVDMGSGKGYLTFALYDYLVNSLHMEAEITGVEYRKDLVDLCNTIAGNAGFATLGFVQSTIEEFDVGNIDVLIALHACDTATDDAIYKGIKGQAELIVVAPCCHKQIRREMEKGKTKNELDFLIRHGIFLERQAEMVTDGLRALILEYFGYKTKIFEFISDVHTPKNVLVVGIKSKKTVNNKEEILNKIRETKTYFGIGFHHLEKLLGL